jgi:hypothetical protein
MSSLPSEPEPLLRRMIDAGYIPGCIVLAIYEKPVRFLEQS